MIILFQLYGNVQEYDSIGQGQRHEKASDISVRVISNALFEEAFKLVEEILEYEYQMSDFKKVK